MNRVLLETRGLTKAFGKVQVANGLDLAFESGVITAIIGPNGAGKSTLINMLSGLIPPDSGEIFFMGRNITRLPIHKRVKMGLCRSFQVVNVFPELTASENIQIPVLAASGRASKAFSPLEGETIAHDETIAMLSRVGLSHAARLKAKSLSHGDQRLLEIGIALAARPKLLFLDEPTAGMNPVERTKILEGIKRISVEGETTFVIVEHDMDVVFTLSDRIVVLHHGDIIGDGDKESIRANPKVREVYLGDEVAQ